MRRGSWRFATSVALVLLLGQATDLVGREIDDDASGEISTLSSDLRVRVERGRDLLLEVRVSEDDSYGSIAERVAGGIEQGDALAALHGPAGPQPGQWVPVPLELLSDDSRGLVLRHLFPDDHRDGNDWIHVARAGRLSTYDEGLWQVAAWFTGNGSQFRELMQRNDLSSPELRSGQIVRVPAKLLNAAFRAALYSDDGLLEFGSDADGPYAGYRLKSGEALYSAVVGRFSGRTEADDVRELAELIRERSGIRDLTDIPVGYMVKIPLDVLEWPYLPATHPRRVAAQRDRDELARELERRPVGGTGGGLDGVLIIVDPGHGGRDLGTMNNGIWEHDYVYDVACRLRQKLERRSAARVVMTLEDRQTGCAPSTTDKLAANRQGTVLTTPPFMAREEGEARIGVNLRWYLANSVYRRALAEGYDADRVLFVSLHADSRHPSLRGMMVYVPGAGYRTRTYGSSSSVYKRYKEVQEKPSIRFSKSDRLRSEAVSRKYADAVVRAFENQSMPIHPHEPVRHRIIRGKQKFVPAVIAGNAIPTKVLVEMVNLSNPKDAAVLASARRRDQLAEALFESFFLHYGERPVAASSVAAAD